MTRQSPVLRLKDVSKRFAQRTVLQAVSLDIDAGERVALLGESGSGKSTLLNLIAGLEPADSGEIQLLGHAVRSLDADQAARLRRMSIGFVFQAFHLLPYLTAQRNVAVPLLLNGLDHDTAMRRAADALASVGLAQRCHALPSQLSGGEQQRVALMRALVHRPALVLADEPTGNLDPHSAGQALQIVQQQVEQTGAALLMVTHSEQAAAIAHRRVTLVNERLQEAA